VWIFDFFLSESSGWWRSKKRAKNVDFSCIFCQNRAGGGGAKKRPKMWIFNEFFVRTERVVEAQKAPKKGKK